MRRIPLFLLVLAYSLAARAEHVACTQFEANVTMLARTGEPIKSPPLDLFHFDIGYRRSQAQAAAAPTDRSRYMLVLDHSGSMLHRWDTVRKATEALLANIPPEDEVGLLVFAGSGQNRLPLKTDRKDIRDVLEMLDPAVNKQPIGQTAIYDALDQALGMFGTPKETDVVLLISDGETGDDRHGDKAISAAFAARGTRLFIIMVNSGVLDPIVGPALGGTSVPAVTKLAKSTGGRGIVLEDKAEDRKITAVASLVLRWIESETFIRITTPKPITKPDLFVVPNDSRNREGYEVLYPYRARPMCVTAK